MTVTFEWEGKSMTEPAEVVLVAVGRKAYTGGSGPGSRRHQDR